MSNPIDQNTMLRIHRYGTYYNPAWKHYGMETNVMCDRCFKTQLQTSIGYGDHDLCLSCISEIATVKPKQETSKMQQVQFKPSTCVPKRMHQRQFK